MASKKEFYDAFFSMAKNYDAKTGIKHNEEDLQKFTGQINDLINTEGHRYGVKKNLESKINTMNKNILLISNFDKDPKAEYLTKPVEFYLEAEDSYNSVQQEGILTDFEISNYRNQIEWNLTSYKNSVRESVDNIVIDNSADKEFAVKKLKAFREAIPELRNYGLGIDENTLNDKIQVYVDSQIGDDMVMIELAEGNTKPLTNNSKNRIQGSYEKIMKKLETIENELGITLSENRESLETSYKSIMSR